MCEERKAWKQGVQMYISNCNVHVHVIIEEFLHVPLVLLCKICQPLVELILVQCPCIDLDGACVHVHVYRYIMYVR